MFQDNCLIIDEASMLTQAEAQIIVQRYPHHRIIFCGDMKYQLPPVIQEGVVGDAARQMTMDGMHVIHFNKNYRSLCKTLDRFTDDLRSIIDDTQGQLSGGEARQMRRDVRAAVIKRFEEMGGKTIVSPDIKRLYADDDMILGYKHNYDAKTTMEEYYGIVAQDREMKKWNLTDGGRDHCKGEIIVAPKAPEGYKAIERYSYTTHCIQGETCRGRIFVNPRHMERSEDVLRLLYTACSRAKRFDQLYFVGGSNCSNVMDELSDGGMERAREAAEREAMGAEDRCALPMCRLSKSAAHAQRLRLAREAAEREAMGAEDRCAPDVQETEVSVWGYKYIPPRRARASQAAWHAVAAGAQPGAEPVDQFSGSNITAESVKSFFGKN